MILKQCLRNCLYGQRLGLQNNAGGIFVEYQIVRLMDKPEMKEQMANWFSEKWSVPLQAYLDRMWP